jgi:hypothetical protein
MPIIYSYPTKTTPVGADMVLITDSESTNPKNQTKKASISSIQNLVSGVSTLTSGNTAIAVSQPTGAVVLTSTAYSGAANIGHVPTGGTGSTFLRGDGTWVVPTDLGLTSVGLAMPAAFAVSSSPLTSNGTITVSGSGTTSQFIDGTGALQTNSLNSLTDVLVDTTDVNNSFYIGDVPTNAASAGDSNISIGTDALKDINAGANGNIAIGTDSLDALTTGDKNIAIGQDALGATNADQNTAVGNAAGSLTTGNQNTLIGYQAALGSEGASTYSEATVVGHGAGSAMTTATRTTLVGHNAGDTIADGASNTLIGYGADVTGAGDSRVVTIGSNAVAGTSGIAIGTAAVAPAGELALGSAASPLTLNASTRAISTYLFVTVNGVRYTLALHTENP